MKRDRGREGQEQGQSEERIRERGGKGQRRGRDQNFYVYVTGGRERGMKRQGKILPLPPFNVLGTSISFSVWLLWRHTLINTSGN